jgi:L-histidine N-alpha-methyltransferase
LKEAIKARILARHASGWDNVAGDRYVLHIDHDEGDEMSLAESVSCTLEDEPRWLHFRWLYDAVGSQIYERITEQPEYYLTRAEDRILADNADTLRELAGDVSLVELGSGSSAKTRRLLDAWSARGATRYVPIDISRSAIEQACRELSCAYDNLFVEGLAARYERALPLISGVSPLMLLFLGSSVGNFDEDELDGFLALLASSLRPGDKLLLGIDLAKEPEIIRAAYNDAAGWTSRFMINLLARLNRELGSGIPLDRVEYEGVYATDLERVEMYLRFTEGVTIAGEGLARPIDIGAGESILVEISRKFHVDAMVDKLADFGFRFQQCFSDPDGFFAVLLLTRAG